eukprot:TRINITY_DN3081_c0_g1_i31.p1 TRINITY_DN3081_c0_g1~~TRINITY_DN3081_c0_g1_i31.p1  ORF type:complete len:249 (-),score=43.81 TRINITY_DN3081_c0_g1_i31:19-765(-)
MEGTTKDVQVKVCNIDQKPAVWTKLDVDEKISKPALLSKIRTKYPEAIDVYSEDDGDAIKIEEELLTVIKGQKFFFRREERKLGEKKEKEKKEQETANGMLIMESTAESVETTASKYSAYSKNTQILVLKLLQLERAICYFEAREEKKMNPVKFAILDVQAFNLVREAENEPDPFDLFFRDFFALIIPDSKTKATSSTTVVGRNIGSINENTLTNPEAQIESFFKEFKEIGRAVQQECRDRSRMPSSA